MKYKVIKSNEEFWGIINSSANPAGNPIRQILNVNVGFSPQRQNGYFEDSDGNLNLERFASLYFSPNNILTEHTGIQVEGNANTSFLSTPAVNYPLGTLLEVDGVAYISVCNVQGKMILVKWEG